MSVKLSNLAIIDMSAFRNGDNTERKKVANKIYNAAHNIGFLYLKNTGMPYDLLEKTFSVSNNLFKSDNKVRIPFCTNRNHGYTAIKGEALDPSKPADLKETFTSRNIERIPSGPDYWPNPIFEKTMRNFYKHVRLIASDVMSAFAIALDMPESFFEEKHTGLTQTLRILHYPPVKNISEGQLGAGAHTDFGTITILFQDSKGGLQVQHLNGEWIDAPPIDGTVVVNTGDLISRWSNDFFKSTPHRVVPRPAAMKNGRLSIAFFSDPDPDVIIETFPRCITPENPQKYDAITAGEHIQKRILASQAKH